MLIVERHYNRHLGNYIKYSTSNMSSSPQSQSSKVYLPPESPYLIVSRLANLCPGTNLRCAHRRTCDSRCWRCGNLLGSLHYHLICRPSPSTTHVLCCCRHCQCYCFGCRASRRRCIHRTCQLAMVFLYQLTHWSDHYRYHCVPPPRAETETIIPPSQRQV